MEYRVKILKIKKLTPDVKMFVLERPERYKFSPGDAVMLAIDKPNWRDKKRPFSLASLPTESDLQLIIKIYAEHKGVTNQLNTAKTNDILILSEPFSSIKYKGPGTFFAGGVGIAPFISMLKLAKKDNTIKDCQLFFSNKTKKDIILESWLKKLFSGIKNGLILTLTREKDSKYLSGRFDEKTIKRYIKLPIKNSYVCGPPTFVSAMKEIILKLNAHTQELVMGE